MEPILRKHCTALILAGGRGTRLGGTDKAALVWRGQRFVDLQYHCLRQQFDTVWINRRDDEPVPTNLNPTELPGPVCYDLLPDHGPLAGIHAGLSQLATPWLMVVPCDAPRLAPELFDYLSRDLAHDLTHNSENQRASQPAPRHPLRYAHDGDRDQYLFALVHHSLLPSLSRYLRSGGRAVRHWYAAQRAIAMDCSAIHSSFTNINTIEHYQVLQKR